MNQKLKNKYLELYEKYGEIKIKCQGASELPLDAITDFQGKLKKRTTENKIRLAASMFKKNFIAPFFIWEYKGDYFDLDGHGRSEVLCEIREAGIPIPAFFPVAYIEADNEQDAREKLLAISSQYGEFDTDELDIWLKGIDDEIKETLRLVDKEMDISIEQETESDDEIPEEIEPITKLGDLWELGDHRLLCGDSTKSEDVERLMNGQKADMVFTDPPYGVNYSSKNEFLNTIDKGNHIQKNIKNDVKDKDAFNLWDKTFQHFKNILTDYHSIYICSPQTRDLMMMMMMMIEKGGVYISNVIIWVKNNHVLGRLDYMLKHEPIIYGWLKKGRHKFYGKGQQKFSTWNFNKPCQNKLHPTMKPVELIENAILNSSEKNMIVIDLFLGSGSTLIACEKTNRICYGMEIDEHYCDVIVQRYKTWCEKNNKKIKIKLNGKPCY